MSNHKPSVNISALNILCAVLALALLILQFTPFWHFEGEDEQSSSIQSYVWFPDSHKELDGYLSDEIGANYTINDVVTMPALVLVLGAVGIVLCLVKSDKWPVSLLPAACGAVGVWGYLTGAAFRLGSGWGLHLALCIALLVIGALSVVSGLKDA